ncbi:class I SAM-dependent methyltransferase [Domibacillus robiginosus]|uniref:class I SAM-dependent methyltransferase n=1 Tax=Domibacillus robiginosus TaxID=1071054 RepID=UPI00067BE72E|nr:class I SAM-dependent methyltransferase [Domibacillus robiginosus]
MDNKKTIASQFGTNAANYVTSKTHAKGKDLDLIENGVKDRKNTSLLDIATGGGHVANKLAPIFKKVTALDLTPEMLENAQSFIESNGHQNVFFVQGDAEALPFPEEHFDTVTCRIAPHHFSNVDQFISESYRVLTEDGLFLLIDNVSPEVDEYDHFYNEVEKKRDPSHFRAYKKSEWISWVEKEGFSILTVNVFEKKFIFDEWCRMMNLSGEVKEALNRYMAESSEEIRNFFSIDVKEEKIQSFKGEAIFLAAVKKKK